MSTRYGTTPSFPLPDNTIVWENDQATDDRKFAETFIVEYFEAGYEGDTPGWVKITQHNYEADAIRTAQTVDNRHPHSAVRVRLSYGERA